MSLGIATGSFLVICTWFLAGATIIMVGVLPAYLMDREAATVDILRRSIWWGLAISSLVLLVLSLISPLNNALIVTGLFIGGVATSFGTLVVRRKNHPRSSVKIATPKHIWWTLAGATCVAQIVLSVAVLGPVTNYDTGLYHLGAISYASDFAAIPGLANLYGPLGYATLEFVWAASLTGTPWDSEVVRLTNGLIMALVVLELLLRLRRRTSPGTYVLLISVVALWGPLLAMADFWIASPTQDASSLLLSLIAIAYLSDSITSSKKWTTDASVALLVIVILISVRTTMIVFAFSIFIVLLILAVKRHKSERLPSRPLVIVGILGFLTVLTMGIRDYLLSGWLWYPLSIHAFDVPWRADDPTGLREATLAFHRNRQDVDGSIEGLGWVPSWLERLPQQWEPYLFLALGACLIGAIALSRKVRTPLPWKKIALATAPSFVALAFWFLQSPPAFRFIWGPLFLLIMTPLGWITSSLLRPHDGDKKAVDMADQVKPSSESPMQRVLIIACSLIVVLASIGTVAWRINWSSFTESRSFGNLSGITYVVAPIQSTDVEERPLASGLLVLQPRETDQCWSVYPMCSPSVSPTLRLRGAALSEGFLP